MHVFYHVMHSPTCFRKMSFAAMDPNIFHMIINYASYDEQTF